MIIEEAIRLQKELDEKVAALIKHLEAMDRRDK